MSTYTISITVRDEFSRAPFLIQTRAPFGVLDYRWAHTRDEAAATARFMQTWHYGKFAGGANRVDRAVTR